MFYHCRFALQTQQLSIKGIKDEGGNKLYFDSLVFSYTKNGLELAEAWDMAEFMPVKIKNYVESTTLLPAT